MYNAIVWQDRRAEPTCAALRARPVRRPCIRDKTGLILDAYFSGTKLKWILDSVAWCARRCSWRGELAFGTVDSWLMWQLTGGQVHATDVSNASRTMLFNMRTQPMGRRVAEAACSTSRMNCCLQCARVKPCLWPHAQADLLGASHPYRRCGGRPAKRPLRASVLFKAGLAKNTYGTGCFMLMHTGEKLPDFAEQRAHHHQRRAARHNAGVRARRQRLHRRCRGAMAARRAEGHRGQRRGPVARRKRTRRAAA